MGPVNALPYRGGGVRIRRPAREARTPHDNNIIIIKPPPPPSVAVRPAVPTSRRRVTAKRFYDKCDLGRLNAKKYIYIYITIIIIIPSVEAVKL